MTSSASTPKIPQPPAFTGNRDVDVVEGWFYRVENYFLMAAVAEDKKLSLATCFLEGDALTWYLANRDDIKTYGEFENQLRDYFLPSNYIPLMSAKFKKLAQSQFSSVADYANALKSMGQKLRKAGRVMEDGVREAFINGLNANIRHYLILRRDTDNISMLIKSALALEESINMEKEKRYRRAPNPAHTGSAESSSSNWRSPTPQLAPATSYDRSATPASRGFQAPTRGHAPTQGSRPRLPDEEYAKRMRNGECLGCGKKGHLQMECPLNAAVKQEVNLLEFSEDEINEAQQYSAIQPIVVPIEIDNHKVLALADSGAAVNLLQDNVVRHASLRPQLQRWQSTGSDRIWDGFRSGRNHL